MEKIPNLYSPERKPPIMSHFWLIVTFLAFCTVAIISLIVLARLIGKSKKAPTAGPAPQTQIAQELVIHGDDFTLIGPDWQWIADQPASYGCPRCGCREDITIRLYQHAFGNQVYLLARHHCEKPTADQATAPMSVIGKAG